ncbi:MAG TPA: hypothetical protein VI386_23255 [Candidatus Sulfotelmatobacter sp.]
MNRIITRTNLVAALLLLTTVAFSAIPAAADKNDRDRLISQLTSKSNVSLGSLYGWYGLLVAGPSATTGAGGKYLTGALYFDGKGNISGYNVNGGINGQVGNTSVTGTYVANTSGAIAGTLTVNLKLANQTAVQTYVVSVRQTTFEAVGIETDGSAIATIDLQNQIVFWSNSFNNAALSGTFASVCTGNPGNYAQMNYVTFDGKGNLAGIDPYDDNNIEGVNPFAGTYTVYPDGTFSAVTAPTVSITGVIDTFYTEIEYTYALSGVGEIISCVGKK